VSTFCSFSRLHLVATLALLSASALCAETLPSYIVTTAADDANGTSANCTDQSLPGAMRDPNCSLRDALAAAASDGANITFDTTVFGANQPVAARTITLGSAGTLSIPANTTITGLPSGGPDFTNLVTISGSGQHQIFSVGSGVANTAISGLNITGGYVDGSTISGGGAIYNAGTLTVSNSSITGNNVLDSLGGGGIFNDVPGVLTIINSTIAGNSAAFSNSFGQNPCNGGGGIYNSDTLIVTNSTITGNSTNLCFVGYGGIFGGGQITNTIVADNYKQTELGNQEDDCDGCVTTGVDGNLSGAGLSSTSPGSRAICAGIIADIPPGVKTDQRGVPRTTTYSTSSGNMICVDSGAIQTHYALSFSTQPPASVEAGISFVAAVQFSESGFPYAAGGLMIPLALGTGDGGSLSGGGASPTNGNGVVTYSNLSVNEPGTADTLVSTFPITAMPPPAPLTSPLAIIGTSSPFDVTQAGPKTVIDTLPTGLSVTVDGGPPQVAPVSVSWTVGSQHTIATTSPQSAPGTQFTFASWSDSGAISHTVTASASVMNYTATFSTSYQLTVAANPPSGGTVSPASGGFYAATTAVAISATAYSGAYFAGWTGETNGAIANPSSPNTTITMNAPENITANFQGPNFMVTVTTDDSGNGANCTDQNQPGAKPDANCSLADALAAAAETACPPNCSGAINVTFDPTVFSTPQTIPVYLPLFIPSNTTIVGPSTGSGTSRTNLVTVSAANSFTTSVFQIPYQSQVVGAVISGITITGGSADTGGGISNGGALTVIDCTISGNSASGDPNTGFSGGGIFNDVPGYLTIINSTISGNTGGGGVYNAPGDPFLSPAGGRMTIINSTISNNAGGNLYNGGTLAVYNSVVDDCATAGVTACPTTGTNGNVVTANSMLAPLANYGGPTPTKPPLPGSPAICAAGGAYTQQDQRGFPLPINYNGTACYDSGAVQTNYSLLFSTEPPANVGTNVSFTSAVQLDESGAPFPVNGVSISLALGAGNNGTLSGGTASTNASGVATYAKLSVSAARINDTLVATLPLTTTPPPAPLTAPISVSATSTPFDVGQSSQTITFTPPASPVTYGVSPIPLVATATSGLAVTFGVLSGPGMVSGHTLTITGVGTVVVAANQAGNLEYAAAPQVTQTIVVNKATNTLALSAAPSNPIYGAAVTFTGTISPPPAGAISSLFSFLIDQNTANSVTVPAATYHNGTATATYGRLHAGAHTVALSFSGTADYAAATSVSVPITVQQATPAITWSPASSIGYGTNAAALLDATANTPGSFSYSAQAAGGNTIALTAATVLPVGSYTLTADFTPADTVDYKAATRAAMLTVAQATLTASANNATRVYGTANPTFTGTLTGAINGDTFTETFATAATVNTDAGTYAIVPSASGSNLADYAVTIKNGILTITAAASATTIASSTPNSNLNESVTFTATVRSSTTGTPVGSVEFLNGSTVLGNSVLNAQGVATYTTSALVAGTQTIDAVYTGNVDFLGSQAMLSQTVTAPGFSLSANPTSLSLSQGETGQIKITLTPIGGYNGSLTFDCTGVPELAACSFNPAALMADGSNTAVSTTMTLTTTGSNHGTVSQNTPASGTASTLLCWLPVGLLSFVLYWHRKRLSPAAKRALWMIVLAAAISGIVACGSPPSTPAGTSTITVTAKSSGSSSQSVTVMVTVNK
jgi:Bacterial Ig-like domain (group 3)/MBG domain (YGX type)/Divergent InlB B-repeat domain